MKVERTTPEHRMVVARLKAESMIEVLRGFSVVVLLNMLLSWGREWPGMLEA